MIPPCTSVALKGVSDRARVANDVGKEAEARRSRPRRRSEGRAYSSASVADLLEDFRWRREQQRPMSKGRDGVLVAEIPTG